MEVSVHPQIGSSGQAHIGGYKKDSGHNILHTGNFQYEGHLLRGRAGAVVLAGEEAEGRELSSGLEVKALATLFRPLVGLGVSHGFGTLARVGVSDGFGTLAGLGATLETLSGLGAVCTGGGVCSESGCRSWEHTSGGAGAPPSELVKPRLWELSVWVLPFWVSTRVAGRLCTAWPVITGSPSVAKIGAPPYKQIKNSNTI